MKTFNLDHLETFVRVIETGSFSAAAAKLGASAVVAIDLDYETLGSGGSMLMVTASGTAVVLE